jgi:L-histidine N-alpha-methyltransferase
VTTDTRILVETHLGPDDARNALREDARRGLTSTPKELPPKWFYDDAGSRLFDQITRLPEYYPTRREREILRARSADVAQLSGADTLVELGSGTSEKTRLLLDSMYAAGTLKRFAPFDVSESTLREAATAIADEYEGVTVHAVVGDFEHHLSLIPNEGRRLVAFLGGTIGNLPPDARKDFFAQMSGVLHDGDTFLLGTDLVKDPARLHAAYDDSAGVTAAFNKNVLSVLNRELRGDFDLDAFEHVARWDAHNEWIEMLLRSTREQTVTLADIGLRARFGAGEEMRTEISAKFRRAGMEAELAAAGLDVLHWWTDEQGDFALSLSLKR